MKYANAVRLFIACLCFCLILGLLQLPAISNITLADRDPRGTANFDPTATVALNPTATVALNPTATVVHSTASYTYTFTIERTALPPLSYTDLSYVVQLGAINNPTVTVNGVAASATRYDQATGTLVFTSDQTGTAIVRFSAEVAPGAITVQVASLKDNKAWAWSHGMDDNVYLQAQIDRIRARGWRGSLMLISEHIDDTREEDWILDKPALRRLRNEGWSLSNHTWDHNCNSDDSAATHKRTTIDGYNKLMEIVATSDDPDYRIISFAAPCFISEYVPVIENLRVTGETTLLFNESQGNPLMNVDGSDYTNGDYTALGISSLITDIGRDAAIEYSLDTARVIFDWMAQNAGSDRHFWYNTFTHGSQEDNLSQILDHVYNNYGPAGTDELWMAPSDEIYSYLLVRDGTTISGGNVSQGDAWTAFLPIIAHGLCITRNSTTSGCGRKSAFQISTDTGGA